MARIELKHCTVRFVDGHSNTGAVNEMTPADGMTDLDVDAITGIIPVGCRFTIVGSTQTYTVTATMETMSNTTNITFTPALATADGIPADNAVITFTGRALEVKVGEGNLTYTVAKEYSYDKDRGILDTVRELDEQPLEVSLDGTLEEIRSISGDDTPTPSEVLLNEGAAATWESSSSDACEPFAIDIEVEIVRPCGGVQREIITFPDFRPESVDYDFQDATISTKGKCNVVTPTVVRMT